ncbi:MAG: LapA family protein [Bacteroidota bacterium]
MRTAKIVLLILLLTLFTVLVLQNTETVSVRLVFVTVTMSRIVLLLMTLLIGFVSGYIVARLGTTRKVQKELAAVKQSIASQVAAGAEENTPAKKAQS